MTVLKKPKQLFLPTKIGPLAIYFSDTKVTAVRFLPTKKARAANVRHPLAKKIITQLNKYFINSSFKINLPFTLLNGTQFEKRVWRALKSIKAGQTKTYQELAQKLKTSPRAVGNALRKNPLPIILPCHRIVAKNGIGGYSGHTKGKLLHTKIWLLNHEKPRP